MDRNITANVAAANARLLVLAGAEGALCLSGPKHGAVIQLTQEEARRLMAHLNYQMEF